MSRRHKKKAHANHERWLVSYADFITLLFAFFVVLYASSQADKKKAAQVSASIKGAFQQLGVFTGSATDDVGIPGSALGDEIRQHEVQMRVTPEGLVVSLREVGFFSSGQAELLENGHTILTRIATVLGGRGFEIRVEGHTDNVPVHNSRFKSNWELSAARSTTVVSLLIERHRFDPSLISAAGYSEYRPLADNDSPQGRAANRRIDLVVVGHVPDKDKLARGEAAPAGTE